MRLRGMWNWMGVGALASAALLGAACGPIPETGGDRPDRLPQTFSGAIDAPMEQVREYQFRTDRGYNGTIVDLGSSIDPRTPEKMGTPGRSLPADLAWRQVGTQGTQMGTGQGEQMPTGGSGMGGQEPPSQPPPLTRPGEFLKELRYGRGGETATPPRD